MERVLKWCVHHCNDEMAQDNDDELRPRNSEILDPWDREFMTIDNDTIFQLILV
jgi:hypothetical protein